MEIFGEFSKKETCNSRHVSAKIEIDLQALKIVEVNMFFPMKSKNLF